MDRGHKDGTGCCGIPAKCAGDTASGRCKAREDWEAAQKPRRRRESIFDVIREDTPPEELAAARESARREARAERRRGDDGCRTLIR